LSFRINFIIKIRLINYLAHAYLSFGHQEILVGNLISDFVKGKKKFDYPPNIQKGIALHRLIDNFTDTHEATKEAKEVFRADYRLYSGAFVDVVYDHFLAMDQTEFTDLSLAHFSSDVYESLELNHKWLPESFALIFPYMKRHNWLFNYRSFRGIKNSFEGLVRRAAYLNESETAFKLFQEHYQLFHKCYRHFWATAKPYARSQFDLLVNQL
jgi:acyl carrier protein phosphodiesterase